MIQYFCTAQKQKQWQKYGGQVKMGLTLTYKDDAACLMEGYYQQRRPTYMEIGNP